MSRYRLKPTPQQESVLLGHCKHARYVWNLCIEQETGWRPGRGKMPRFTERCRQLTEARADNAWLAAGSVIVQQQAIRDHGQAMQKFFTGACGRPSWRKANRDEGFRVVAVGSSGVRKLLRCPGLTLREQARLVRLERKLAHARRGSNRRARARAAVAHVKAMETDRRIDRSGWGILVRRLEDKAPGRVEKVPPAYTSQRCSACGHVASESRESQALFRCVACKFACNADVNAARNIAAGHAVKARGGDGASRPVNREPQLALLPA